MIRFCVSNGAIHQFLCFFSTVEESLAQRTSLSLTGFLSSMVSLLYCLTFFAPEPIGNPGLFIDPDFMKTKLYNAYGCAPDTVLYL